MLKWFWIAALYEQTAQGFLRIGKMLTRKEFLAAPTIIATPIENIADLAFAGREFMFIKSQPQPVPEERVRGLIKVTR